jgi:monoamine oxidase
VTDKVDGVDRRGFLIGSASSALLLASGGLRSAPKRADVTIIGGGLAGLYAAMLLADNGATCVVLEAADRPGGRVFTADDVPGRPEYGANQIGPSYARVRDVARRLGVELLPGANVNAPYSFIIDGQLLTPEQWPDSPLNKTVGAERERLPHTLKSLYVDARTPFDSIDDWLSPDADRYDISLYRWLKEQGASEAAIQLIDEGLVDPGVHGASALKQLQEATRSMVETRGVLERSTDENLDIYQQFALSSSRVAGGCSRLTEAMAREVGERLHLNSKVVSVDQNDSGCEVSCADGSRYLSDYVISAVPFTVLRRIRFRPLMPALQGQAVATLPYGRQSQVLMSIKEPYWEEDGINASMFGTGPLTLIRQQIDADGSRIKLNTLAVGRKAGALDLMPPEQRGQFVLDYLARVRPSTRGRLQVEKVFSWEEVPTALGCSHGYAPGQMARFRREMVAPHGRVHMAGEHTRRLEVGMESAMESGERTVLEILQKAWT